MSLQGVGPPCAAKIASAFLDSDSPSHRNSTGGTELHSLMRCSFILVFWCEFVIMPVLVHVVPNFCVQLPVRLWVGRLPPLPAESLWIVSSKQKWWCLLVCFSPVIGSGWKPVKLHPKGKQLYYLNIARKILASYFGIMITTFAVLYKEQPVTSKSDPD